jgi:hypothetical protein
LIPFFTDNGDEAEEEEEEEEDGVSTSTYFSDIVICERCV